MSSSSYIALNSPSMPTTLHLYFLLSPLPWAPACVSDCLVGFPTFTSNRHLKRHMFKTEFLISPQNLCIPHSFTPLLNGNSILPVAWAKSPKLSLTLYLMQLILKWEILLALLSNYALPWLPPWSHPLSSLFSINSLVIWLVYVLLLLSYSSPQSILSSSQSDHFNMCLIALLLCPNLVIAPHFTQSKTKVLTVTCMICIPHTKCHSEKPTQTTISKIGTHSLPASVPVTLLHDFPLGTYHLLIIFFVCCLSFPARI